MCAAGGRDRAMMGNMRCMEVGLRQVCASGGGEGCTRCKDWGREGGFP